MVERLVERLSALTTSVVSDALDGLGIVGQCHGLRGVTVEQPLIGLAYTVRFAPVSPNSDATVGDYLEDMSPGEVIVLDNGGRTDATVWGDLLSLSAQRRGIAGTLIDGVCRDAASAAQIGYPIYARGNYMRTGKDRVQVVEVQGPVNCSTAQVGPGDVVFGDRDGVLAIPHTRADEVLDLAEHIEQREASIRAAVLAGALLRDARAEHGYFELQREQGA